MSGTTGGRTTKTVHQAIAAVSRDVQAVGKSGRNDEDGYSFRTIDDVMTALNPALAKHGVHIAPKVLTHHAIERSSGTSPMHVMRLVELEVRFRIYGPNGDRVDVTTWGEGLDSSDKATSKAHTAALKNALLPAFMIPTANLVVDGDASSPAAPDAAHRRIVAAEAHRAAGVDKLDGDVEGRRLALRAQSFRAEVLAAADEFGEELARLEVLEAIRSRASECGVLDVVVDLPAPWVVEGHDATATLFDLIAGARVGGLPHSGETPAPQGDPWDVSPESRKGATS